MSNAFDANRVADELEELAKQIRERSVMVIGLRADSYEISRKRTLTIDVKL